jgi:hypothetical protein
VVLLFGTERLARSTGQSFDEESAGVMAGILVVSAGISQTNHHDNILHHSPLPSSVQE